MKWIIPLFVISLFVTCQDKDDLPTKKPESERVVVSEKPELPHYVIVNQDVSDAPIKTQVVQHILQVEHLLSLI